MGFGTMILIAHRGNIYGPDADNENSPRQIDKSISEGYDCEIDLWRSNGQLYLGHAKPQYQINVKKLAEWQQHVWIHAKNIELLSWLRESDFNYFWHDKDAFSITSKGHIWCYPSVIIYDFGINLMPEWNHLRKDDLTVAPGICSDFIEKYI